MILYHATPKSNLKSIEANGLQPRRSKGKIKGVWLHTASRRHWAILHTQQRHKSQEIVLLEVNVSRSRITRKQRGIWYATEPITQFREEDINAILE